ncbi:MAG: hypothetical protein R3F59_01020 [Myxococcota bacterium]
MSQQQGDGAEIRAALVAANRGGADPHQLLRAVAAARWHLPLGDDGEPMVFSVAEPPEELLVAELEPTAARTRTVAGGELPGLAQGLGGVALEPETPRAVVLRAPALEALRRIGRSDALAAALAAPGPGQGEAFRTGPYWVLGASDAEAPATVRERILPVFTAPEHAERAARIEPGRLAPREVDGAALWAGLAARDDYDGITFDLHRPGARAFGPHLARGLAAGADPRPGADPLPARTVAEIHRWLDEHRAAPDRKHALVRREGEDELVALYLAVIDHVPQRIAFRPVEPTLDPDDLGAGPTAILCAGQLLLDARSDLSGLPPKGRDPAQQARARRAARWLEQLEALLQGDRIPFTALRTPHGAAHWRREPELYTAGWIREQRAAAG